MTLSLLLLVLALICFGAAVGVTSPRVNLVALGLALTTLATLLGGLPLR